jgi:hypothetical protein
MNWKLVGLLSLFGLGMGLATVFWIPSNTEPVFWLVVLGGSAYILAIRLPAQLFLHGVLVGLANSIWVTACHLLLFTTYIANHPREAAMVASMPSPRLTMALAGPLIGLASGVVIGLLAILARKLGVTQRPRSAAA